MTENNDTQSYTLHAHMHTNKKATLKVPHFSINMINSCGLFTFVSTEKRCRQEGFVTH